jgi:hypothetical protein
VIVKVRKRPGGTAAAGGTLRTVGREEGIDTLTRQGLDAKRAGQWFDSGAGPRTVAPLTVKQRFRRYAPVAGDKGKGYFLTDVDAPVYKSSAEAAKALDLKNPPQFVQVVEITVPVDALKSGVGKGAVDAVQYALPRNDVYRIIEEVPLRCRTIWSSLRSV